MVVKELLVLASGCLLTGVTWAADVTLNGASVKFSFDDSLFGGAFAVVGDSLTFSPDKAFELTALGSGPTVDFASQRIAVRIDVTRPGFQLSGLDLAAAGYWRQQLNPDANDLLTGSQAYADVTVTDAALVNATGHFESVGEVTSTSKGGLLSEGFWRLASARFDDLSGASAEFVVEFNLRAFALGGGKDEFASIGFAPDGVARLTASTAPVPLPPALWLLVSGMSAVFGMRRHQRQL